jgi:hypothetical protein
MTDWTSLDYAVVDVEGNGQQPPDLVELAVVPVRSGVIGESASWLVRPGRPYHAFRHPDSRPRLQDTVISGEPRASRARPRSPPWSRRSAAPGLM